MLSAVSAEGNFTELNTQINESTDELVLDTDYVYDEDSDSGYENGINISKTDFVLDGKGHSIDANNQSGKIFTLTNASGNLTIKNIIFKNLNGESAVEVSNTGRILFDNVTFINCNSTYGALFINTGAYIAVNNSKFISNTGDSGSDIRAVNVYDVSLENTLFEGGFSRWAHVYIMNGENILVDGCTFQNSSANYSCAIYLWSYQNPYGNLNVRKSRFSNLEVRETAGAIGVKGNVTLNVDRCEFSHLLAAKDGGAIYADLDLGVDATAVTTISNSLFKDCLAEYGGAVLQLAGYLNIINSTFDKNTALYSGGALWASHAVITVDNSTFTDNINTIVREGGALSIDYSDAEIKNSLFKNNTGSVIGNAIYAYDSDIAIVNNEFIDNGNAVYTTFSTQNITSDNIFNNDTISLNNTLYATLVSGEGIEIKLINNTITVDSLPSRFNLNDWGWVSPVKNQGKMGSCWTFGSCGALESALLKSTGVLYDFSEDNVQNTMIKYSIYGSESYSEGAEITTGAGYFLAWFGPFDKEWDTYDELGKVSPVFDANASVHVQDVIFIKSRSDALDNDNLKRAILNYGSLLMTYMAFHGAPYYNEKTAAQYYNGTVGANHGVSIVGWDDDFSRENFLITPPGDGAWIVKNSWGENWGDGGYFYLSYYDHSFINGFPCVGFILNNTVLYNKVYQTDFTGLYDFITNLSYYTTAYNVTDDDYVAAVGTYFNDSGVDYKFDIYVNDKLKYSQNGVSPYFGFHTIKLDKYVRVSAGDEVRVIFKSNAVPFQADSRQYYIENISFIGENGNDWHSMDEMNATVCLKVYTTDKPLKYDTILKATKVSMVYNSDKYCTITLKDENGNLLKNKKVSIIINGKTYIRTTNSKGQAKITVNLVPKTYAVKVQFKEDNTYYGSTAKTTIKIKKATPKLTAKSKTFKVKTKTKKYSVILKNNKGKVIKNAKVTLKIKGKTYTAKTNAKGKATFKITKLNKKGTFKSVVKFKASKYYKAVAKKVKIKVKR